MRAICVFALLLACCAWAVCGQAGPGDDLVAANTTLPTTSVVQQPEPGVWDKPIHFNTKAKDACTMVVSGHGLMTKLRVTCRSKGRSYWCEYLGRPNVCRPYNTKPRHYFTQIMWDMRKLHNACQGLHSYKPKMCHASPAEAQVVFHKSWPRATKPKTPPPAKLPKPGKPSVSKTAPPRKPMKGTTLAPMEVAESSADKLAKEYCWKSLQGVCTYIISWFQN